MPDEPKKTFAQLYADFSTALEDMRLKVRAEPTIAGSVTEATTGLLNILPIVSAAAGIQSIPGIMGSAWKWINEEFGPTMNKWSDSIFSVLLSTGWLPKELHSQFKSSLAPLGVSSPLIMLLSSILILGEYVKGSVDVTARLTEQGINKSFRPNIPGPGEVMRAAFIDPPAIAQWRDLARKAGLREEHIDLLLKSAYSAQDLGTIRTLYFWNGKDAAYAYKRLRENGFTDERIKEQIDSWPVIPGIADLITMMVKEAFNDSASSKFGLDDEYPGVVAEWAGKQGLDPEWVKRYWRAHWQHVSPGQAFEMLHRGLLEEGDVADLLKVLDYPTYWREKLIQLSYNPVTRIDIRRMYQDGMITIADVEARYRKIGYDPEDAKLLADWTAAEYGKTEATATTAEVISAYGKGFLQKAEAEQMLAASGWPAEKIAFQLQLADQKRSAAATDDIVETLRTAFTGHIYEEAVVRSRLLSLDITGDMVDGLIAVWSMKRDLIDEQTRRKEAIADLEEIRKTKRDAVKAELLSGEITEAQAVTRLIADGFALDLATALVDQWSVTTTVEDRLPTRSDLDRFYRAKLITEAQYKSYMKRSGYSTELASLYFRALASTAKE